MGILDEGAVSITLLYLNEGGISNPSCSGYFDESVLDNLGTLMRVRYL